MKAKLQTIIGLLIVLGLFFSCTNPGEFMENSPKTGNDARYVTPPSYNKIKSVMTGKGYRFFTGELNINIIAIRDSTRTSNSWDDRLCVVYQEGGQNKVVSFSNFTTDPGTYYLQNPVHSLGCAIVAPGQYRGAYQIGYHNGQYEALVQRGNLSVYRDNNKDSTLNLTGPIRSGLYGINLHHGYGSSTVGQNSAGCQVLRYPADLTTLLDICRRSAAIYGSSFTYTVLNESDF